VVTQTYTETQDDLETDELSEDESSEGFEAVEASDSQEATDDPVAAMSARLAELEQTVTSLRGELNPTQIKRELGQIRSLQADVAKIGQRNPFAEVDPRLSSHEEVLVKLANAVAKSVATDDDDRRDIQGILSRLDSARTERDRARIKTELIDEIKAQTSTQPEPEEAQPNPEAERATAQVLGYAEAKGVDPTTIPAATWGLLPGETLQTAIARVKKTVDELATGGLAKRAESRTQAAGKAPARSGSSQSDMDRYIAYGSGEIDIPDKELRALESRLKARGEI